MRSGFRKTTVPDKGHGAQRRAARERWKLFERMGEESSAKRLSVVIPVFNEAPNLRSLVGELIPLLRNMGLPFEVIFVDDGSTDGSGDIVRKISREERNVKVVSFPRNYGQTAAFDAGFKGATGEIVVTMDGDLQNDPRDIPRLLEKIGPYDMVCGWRWRRSDGLLKRLSSAIANYIRRKACGDRFRDIGCSLKAYKRECLAKIKLYDGMHRFLPILFEMEGFKVAQMKVDHRPRRFEKSKYNIRKRLVKPYRAMKCVVWLKKNRLNYEVKREG